MQQKKKLPIEAIPVLGQLLIQFINLFRGTPQKRLQRALNKRIKARQRYLSELFGRAAKPQSEDDLTVAEIPDLMREWDAAYPRPVIDDFR
jgi:hypothetical protein